MRDKQFENLKALFRPKKSHFKSKMACLELDVTCKLFFRRIFRSQSVYYIYQANEKQNECSCNVHFNIIANSYSYSPGSQSCLLSFPSFYIKFICLNKNKSTNVSPFTFNISDSGASGNFSDRATLSDMATHLRPYLTQESPIEVSDSNITHFNTSVFFREG